MVNIGLDYGPATMLSSSGQTPSIVQPSFDHVSTISLGPQYLIEKIKVRSEQRFGLAIIGFESGNCK